MNLIKVKALTALNLGVSNLSRVLIYQLGVRVGFNPVKQLKQAPIKGLLFHSNSDLKQQEAFVEKSYEYHPFGWMPAQKLTELSWNVSSLTGKSFNGMKTPWFLLSDFDSDVGDIKGIWEASRFDWVLGLARDYLKGRKEAIDELNLLTESWLTNNAPYLGPNWKCGQEASIRVMHLAFTAKLLSQVTHAEPVLLEFIKSHLKRIAPTISYAIAQDNNHGTSEAGALYIGGSWLVACGDKSAIRWQNMGRKWLENRAARLIESDGSFSQYSVNYHRVMLDTYSMVELWRRELDLKPFSQRLYKKISLATRWLYAVTQKENGDVPNLGANDGARLLQLSDTDYRDFRPSVQLASVLFLQSSAWQEPGAYDEPLALLGLNKPVQTLESVTSFHFTKGGYIGLKSDSGAFVLFNYPNFRFRPSQNDALHVDFWLNGINLLRDGGTFSYNAGQGYIDYYGGTQSHNTVQFDEHDQMPRLSRFLLGAWLKAKGVYWDTAMQYCRAGYRDYMGCEHSREVTLSNHSLLIVDTICGVKRKAVLRWRLNSEDWIIDGNSISSSFHTIIIHSDIHIQRMELVEGRESRYYYQENSIPVLEIEVASDGKIITEYNYSK